MVDGARSAASKCHKVQIGKELKNLRSTDTLADHYRTIRINAVKLKDRLRNIDTDCAKLARGRLPSIWALRAI